MSAFNRAGLTTTFGHEQGVIRKADGTIILAGKHINGMYLLDTIDNIQRTLLTMGSLSKPTSLEQWHQ